MTIISGQQSGGVSGKDPHYVTTLLWGRLSGFQMILGKTVQIWEHCMKHCLLKRLVHLVIDRVRHEEPSSADCTSFNVAQSKVCPELCVLVDYIQCFILSDTPIYITATQYRGHVLVLL